MITLTIASADSSPAFAGNTHRMILQGESETAWFGWPDPEDKRNSEHWKPGQDKPLEYPKFAWSILQATVCAADGYADGNCPYTDEELAIIAENEREEGRRSIRGIL